MDWDPIEQERQPRNKYSGKRNTTAEKAMSVDQGRNSSSGTTTSRIRPVHGSSHRTTNKTRATTSNHAHKNMHEIDAMTMTGSDKGYENGIVTITQEMVQVSSLMDEKALDGNTGTDVGSIEELQGGVQTVDD